MTTNIQFVAAGEAGVSIPDGLRSYRFFVHDINDPHLYFVYSR